MGDRKEAQPPPLTDRYGRTVTYLRVSVTDRCDFRCVYCMSEHMKFLPRRDLLTLEELDRIASAFVVRGVDKLRLTGGEPLVRRNIMWLFERLARHLDGGRLKELTLTTNGSRLKAVRARSQGRGRQARQRLARHARPRPLPRHHAPRRPRDRARRPRRCRRRRAQGQDQYGRLEGRQRGRDRRAHALRARPRLGPDADRDDAAGRGRGRPHRPVPAAVDRARAPDAPLYAHRHPPPHRRPGALRPRRRDRRPARLHHAAHAQFLRELQPRAPHLHRHALHVPRAGGRRRPARAVAGKRGRRAAQCRDRPGAWPQSPRATISSSTGARASPPSAAT